MTHIAQEELQTSENLFGWDETPGIVSVWASRAGKALVWRRIGEQVVREEEQFRPWLFARILTDLEHLGSRVQPTTSVDAGTAPITFRELDGPPDAYRYLLSARDGRMLEQALCTGASRRLGRKVTILEAPSPDQEARLIVELCKVIRERDPDIIENHNLFGFDLPFLEKRASALKVSLTLGRAGGPQLLEGYEEALLFGPRRRRRMRYSVAGRELIDTLDAVGRYDFVVRELPSHRLKDVARYFGLASPERVYLEGSKVYETYRQDPERVRHYALDDVKEVDGLSRRLMGAAFALASMAPRRYERIASAGPAMGILEPMLVRAYLSAGAALPYTPPDVFANSEPHAGGATYLLAAGVAEHVVKTDVASLYPSLMRIFRIGPACDGLGVLLHILDRLTDLRLHHKAAAKAAPPGSMEANQHDGTQAAMKTLINAAYGYMGAGSMALFADPDAANEVTRRGRELLDHILDAL